MALPASRLPCRATITSALGDFRKRRRLGRDSRSVAKTRCSSSLNASTSPRSALRTRISATCAWARWEGIVTTETLHDTSFAAHLQPAPPDSSERGRRGRAGDRGLRRIRCRFGRPRPLNPFAACRDQRTNGRKVRNGIRRGKPQHSAGGFNPRNENGCDRRVRPHPPPRRSGGPPGCLHPGGPASIFSTMAARSHVLPTTQTSTLATGGRALADHAADVRFCTDHFIRPIARERPCALA